MDFRHRDVFHIFQLCVSRYDICVKRTEPQRGSFSVVGNPITRPHKIKPRTNVFFRACTRGGAFSPELFQQFVVVTLPPPRPDAVDVFVSSEFALSSASSSSTHCCCRSARRGACLPSAAAPLVASSTLIIIDGVEWGGVHVQGEWGGGFTCSSREYLAVNRYYTRLL